MLHPDAVNGHDARDGHILKLHIECGPSLRALRVGQDIRIDWPPLPTGAWLDPEAIDRILREICGNTNMPNPDR